jgi:hypothetical protein
MLSIFFINIENDDLFHLLKKYYYPFISLFIQKQVTKRSDDKCSDKKNEMPLFVINELIDLF